ncbi:MAG: tyrosine-protein phosphatase [Clostridia bacterium]|nr:tyrosine-protein phosphatase [Clostridia bacterium]
MKNMKHIFSVLLSVMLLVCLAMPSLAEGRIEVSEIQKYGNLVLQISGSELLAQGYDFGDIVTVNILGTDYDMPVGSNYSDVDQGSMICRVVIREDSGEDHVILAVNMGDLATTAGIAIKEQTEEDPGYVWHLNAGVEAPVGVTISMKEKGGYYDSFVMHQLVRSENREDYPDLTDEQFANFRMVTTTGVGEGKLYRSSSPVNPGIARSTQADAAARNAGVKTFINLADNEEVMKDYEGFSESYYSQQAVIPLNLGVDFAAEDFRMGLADGIRFIAKNEAPYLVHCNEGKDRAGFVSAVLECLMGADAGEVTEDYMVTYYNYYGVQPGTEQYGIVAASNIRKSLAAAFGLESIEGADLSKEAEEYLHKIGVSEEDIAAVRANLSK